MRLRHVSGLSSRTREQAGAAIAGSWAFCHVMGPDDEIVGMGRIIGDGGWYFVVADLAVVPDHQGHGVGGAVLDALLDQVWKTVPSGAYVTLTADPPGRRLYESRGFVDVAPERTGMHLAVGGESVS